MWEALGPGLLGLCLKMALRQTLLFTIFIFQSKILIIHDFLLSDYIKLYKSSFC